MNTRFADQPIGASASLIGARSANADELANMDDVEVILYNEEVDKRIGAPPSDFDARTGFPDCAKVIGDIRDQSNCGCCWAFGTAEAASDRLCIATKGKTMVPLSSEDLCFNSNFNGCGGGSPESAWSYIERKGIVSGKQQAFKAGTAGPNPDPFAAASTCSDFSLPHCHHHGPVGKDPFPAEGAPGCASQKSPKGPKECDAGSSLKYDSNKYTFTGTVANVGRNETYLKQEIMANGPVTVAFTVYSDFENYAGGGPGHRLLAHRELVEPLLGRGRLLPHRRRQGGLRHCRIGRGLVGLGQVGDAERAVKSLVHSDDRRQQTRLLTPSPGGVKVLFTTTRVTCSTSIAASVRNIWLESQEPTTTVAG
jgi:cathepsin B